MDIPFSSGAMAIWHDSDDLFSAQPASTRQWSGRPGSKTVTGPAPVSIVAG
jgi:hypothetical protein